MHALIVKFRAEVFVLTLWLYSLVVGKHGGVFLKGTYGGSYDFAEGLRAGVVPVSPVRRFVKGVKI